MRIFTLLTLSCAALTVSACSMMSKDETPPPAAKQEMTDVTPAASLAPSVQEEKEMAALMGEADADMPAAEVESVEAEDLNPDGMADTTAPVAETMDEDSETAKATPVTGAPKECPGVEILPDTKSITYFDDPEGKPTGAMIARASLEDIRGGCDYAQDSVVVDIDMIMKGRITDQGRYEGRQDLEAFMTFPYFIAVMDPSGKMIDKKIMATAMRFKPNINDLDHAEKITQTIPLTDISTGPQYTITVGFQLNRAQLDYNRGTVSAPKKAPEKKAETSSLPDAVMKADPTKESASNSDAATDATKSDATPSQAPAATESSASKMKPIVD